MNYITSIDKKIIYLSMISNQINKTNLNEPDNYKQIKNEIQNDLMKPTKNLNSTFIGYQGMKDIMLTGDGTNGNAGLNDFRKWAKNGEWNEFHTHHYDWWVFPIPEKSGFGLKYTVYLEDILELKKDTVYINNLIECATLVCKSWGWDLINGLEIDKSKLGIDQKWADWPIRLYKMTLSLICFGIEKEAINAINYGKLLIKEGNNMSYGGRDLKYLFIK